MTILPNEDLRFTQFILPNILNHSISHTKIDFIFRNQWPANFTIPYHFTKHFKKLFKKHFKKNNFKNNFKKLIIHQPFEFGVIPNDWINSLQKNLQKNLLEIWLPSEYCKEIYLKSGLSTFQENIIVIPHGVILPKNLNLNYLPYYNSIDNTLQNNIPHDNYFTFLFRGGSLSRKGIDLLIDIYFKTFTKKDKVLLILQSSYGDLQFDLLQKIKSFKNTPSIKFITKILTLQQTLQFYQFINLVILPSRSEGFGLIGIESLSYGIPIIVTGKGAFLEYCNNNVCYLIKSKKEYCKVNPCSKRSIFGMSCPFQPTWFEPNLEHLSFLMRHVYNSYFSDIDKNGINELKWKGILGRIYCEEFWNWKEMTLQLMKERFLNNIN